MNIFARLIDPSAPVPRPRTMQGRVHILADESKHRTKVPVHGEVRGLPRLEMRYELDDSVFFVSTPTGTVIADVYIPVMCWVPTAPTKTGRRVKTEGMLP